MKAKDVQINATYLVKVAGNLVPVTITHEHDNGGWMGRSVKTGKQIRIKSPQRLRKRLEQATADKAAEQVRQDIAETVDAVRNGNLAEGIKVPITRRKTKGDKPMSLLDAAAYILGMDATWSEHGGAMTCGEIVQAALDLKLWEPRTGKTPANTLNAAIAKEIKTKGDDSRFVKVERGKYALAKKN